MEQHFYNQILAEQARELLKEYNPRRDLSYYESKYNRYPHGDIQSSLMLLQKEGLIIGCISSLADQAWVHNKTVNIRTLADYYVKPEFRGYGIHLLLGYLSNFPNDIFLVFPNQVAAPLYEKLRWRNISSVFKRYYFPIDIPYSVKLRMHCRIPMVPNSAFQRALHAYINWQKRRAQQDRTYEIYKDLFSFFKDQRICQLWTERGQRTADFVSSITREHFEIYESPVVRSKVMFIAIYDKRRQPSAACIIVFDERMHAEITEYAGEHNALKLLFAVALEAVSERGGRVVAVTTSISKHARLLEGLLFVKGGQIDAYVYSKNLHIREPLNQVDTFCICSGISDGWL